MRSLAMEERNRKACLSISFLHLHQYLPELLAKCATSHRDTCIGTPLQGNCRRAKDMRKRVDIPVRVARTHGAYRPWHEQEGYALARLVNSMCVALCVWNTVPYRRQHEEGEMKGSGATCIIPATRSGMDTGASTNKGMMRSKCSDKLL